MIGKWLKPKTSVLPPSTPEISQRSGRVVGNYLDRRRVESATKKTQAQSAFVNSVTELWNSFANLNTAQLEHERTVAMLEDAETVLTYDARERARQKIEAEQAHMDAETLAEIRGMDRRMELELKREQYAQFMAARSGTVVPPGQTTRDGTGNQAQREFQADRDQALKHDWARAETEEKFNEYAERNGGWDNLTEKQKEHIEGMREKLEELIRESGKG